MTVSPGEVWSNFGNCKPGPESMEDQGLKKITFWYCLKLHHSRSKIDFIDLHRVLDWAPLLLSWALFQVEVLDLEMSCFSSNLTLTEEGRTVTRVRYCNQMTASERTYTSHEHRWLQYYSHVFHHFPAKTAADGEEQGWAWSKGRNSTHSRICLRRKVRTKLINGSKDQNLTGSQMHQVQFSPHYGQTITSILRRASTISCQYYRI